jgi:hypothetical protein
MSFRFVMRGLGGVCFLRMRGMLLLFKQLATAEHLGRFARIGA